MRIAFVSTIFAFPWGGADTLWTRAAEAAQARGDTLLLAVTGAVASHPRVRRLRNGGALLCERPIPPAWPSRAQRLARRLGRLLRRPDPLADALRRFAPDLVVFSAGGTYDLLLETPACTWLREAGVRYRLVANWQAEHPVLAESDRLEAARRLEGADALFFVSSRNLAVTRRHLLAALPQARVVHNPLRWTPEDAAPWPRTGAWSLATVSRLDLSKGVHLLLQAAAEALGGDADWRLDIFGQGPAEGYWRAAAGHLGLERRVRFRGYVPRLADIWAENRLMVSPAIDDGVPMTIPEAMLCARPVLATAVGGAEDWLGGGGGFLCPAPTVPLLAASLRRAWEARGEWEALGRAAAERARALYRPDDYLHLIAP